MSYEEIAQAMDTSVPSVKSLLVRARISLAEATQARLLTCGEVRLELAEAAEGLRKVSGPVRRHVRDCDECSDFRSQVRSNDKVLAALFPAGGLLALKSFIAGKLGFGGASGGAATGAAGAGAGGAATGAVGSVLGGSGAAGGIGAVGGAIGSKAVAGVVTAAVLTAGAVEVKQQVDPGSGNQPAPLTRQAPRHATSAPAIAHAHPALAAPVAAAASAPVEAPPAEPATAPAEAEHVAPVAATPGRRIGRGLDRRRTRYRRSERDRKPTVPAVTDNGAQSAPPRAAAPSSSPSAAAPPAPSKPRPRRKKLRRLPRAERTAPAEAGAESPPPPARPNRSPADQLPIGLS